MAHCNVELTEAEVARLDESLREAGQQTRLRIAPVIVDASGNYDRAEDMLGFYAAALALALVWVLFTEAEATKIASEKVQQVLRIGLIPVIFVITAGFLGGIAVATHLGSIKRVFIPKKHMARAVADSARHAFYRECHASTNRCRELVLVYLSLYERKIDVVADDEVLAKLPPEDLVAFRTEMEVVLRRDGRCEAMCRAIQCVAAEMAKPFPADAGDSDAALSA